MKLMLLNNIRQPHGHQSHHLVTHLLKHDRYASSVPQIITERVIIRSSTTNHLLEDEILCSGIRLVSDARHILQVLLCTHCFDVHDSPTCKARA